MPKYSRYAELSARESIIDLQKLRFVITEYAAFIACYDSYRQAEEDWNAHCHKALCTLLSVHRRTHRNLLGHIGFKKCEVRMIRSTIRMAIASLKMGDVLGVLNPMTERIRADPGCLGCHVYLDLQESSVLMFEQLWKSEEDLTRHLRSHEYRSVLLLMEMAIAQPEVRFEAISHTSGFETIELARA